MSTSKIILIAGPTASGKSALALDLARQTQGMIINADAMQVYAGLPILTAQPDTEEQKQFPHRLYGATDPSEASSAGKWLALAQKAIHEAIEKKCTPILVGGTGLYFKALLGGLADIPDIPENIRAQTQKLYDEIGEEKFRHELAKHDPESASRLAKNDRQRLIRAYEVAAHTGKALGEWQTERTGASILDSNNLNPAIDAHLLMPPREKLYAACDTRFEQMIHKGAIEEVKKLLERKLDPALPAMKILEFREITSCLNGETALEQAVAKAQQATRNYAKRQMTWFRNQWPFDQKYSHS